MLTVSPKNLLNSKRMLHGSEQKLIGDSLQVKVSPLIPSAMGSEQEGDKRRRVLTNPLISGLMTDGTLGMLEAQSARDQFWIPARVNVFFHRAQIKSFFSLSVQWDSWLRLSARTWAL
jgi:hypothetical protein